MTTATRDAAYDQLRRSGEQLSQRERVRSLLASAKYPLIRSEIAGRLGIQITSVCGRLAELMEDGVVAEDKPRLNPVTGVACTTYRLVRAGEAVDAEQGDLFGEVAV